MLRIQSSRNSNAPLKRTKKLAKFVQEVDLKVFWFTDCEIPEVLWLEVFTKTADELETVEDKWLYLLKHAGCSD